MCGKPLRAIITRNRWPWQNVRPDQFQFCCCKKMKENTFWRMDIAFEYLMLLFRYHVSFFFKIPSLCSCGMNSWQYLVFRNVLSHRDHQSSKSWQVNKYNWFLCTLTIEHCWFFIHSYLFKNLLKILVNMDIEKYGYWWTVRVGRWDVAE